MKRQQLKTTGQFYSFKYLKTGLFSLTLGLLGLSSCSNDDIEPSNLYVEIPDAHFEAILVEQGIDSDGTINGQILRTEAESISKLDLNLNSNHGEIADLTGIEGFTNLTFLSAANQQIESIDLSSNTQLDTLIFFNNYLTEIDLSANSKLIWADLNFNELSSISGLSNSESLKIIDLSYNFFEHLTIASESIETLFVMQNQLKTIDVSGVTNLRSMLLTTNQLETVDLTGNTLLETLILSDNQIAELDLSQNTSLTHFYISSNALINLDVSQNTALVDLRVDRNPTLSCIKIGDGQNIASSKLSEYQQLNTDCF